MNKQGISSIKQYGSWLVATAFYVYQYMLRILPNVMVDEIRPEFGLDASAFSSLGFLYLLGYSLMQIPLGLSLDRIGVKPVLLGSILSCSFGSFLFCTTHDFYLMQVARLIIGVSSAVAFMAAVKLAADNLPEGRRGIFVGASLAAGSIGALVSGNVLLILKNYYDWRTISVILSFIGLCLCLMVVLFVERDVAKANEDTVTRSLIRVAKSKNVIIYATFALALYAPLSTIADLWGTYLIKIKLSLDSSEASSISLISYLGLAFGSVILPWLGEKLDKIDEVLYYATFLLLILFSILLYAPHINHVFAYPLMVGIGFASGGVMLCFTAALSSSNNKNSGIVIGIVNTINMLGNGLMQQLVGNLLDLSWNGTTSAHGLREYNDYNLMLAFSPMTTLLVISLILAYRQRKSIRHKIQAPIQ